MDTFLSCTLCVELKRAEFYFHDVARFAIGWQRALANIHSPLANPLVIPHDLHPLASVITGQPSCYGAVLFNAASKDAEFRGADPRDESIRTQNAYFYSLHQPARLLHDTIPTLL
jgi:hypothetical protein